MNLLSAISPDQQINGNRFESIYHHHLMDKKISIDIQRMSLSPTTNDAFAVVVVVGRMRPFPKRRGRFGRADEARYRRGRLPKLLAAH